MTIIVQYNILFFTCLLFVVYFMLPVAPVQARKLKFFSFIRRIMEIYSVFLNHNPEIGTEPCVGMSDSRLTSFKLWCSLTQ